ncbi:MAG: restriction endonuclease subunit S [Bacteroidales bacterium]
MLEGLEISIVNFQSAKSIVNELRWDSDYYKKEYLRAFEIIHRIETLPFSSYCDFIKKGIFDLPPSNYREQGIPLVRTTEIKNPTVNFHTTVYLEEATNRDNYKTILYPYDLVFTKIGAYIGDVAMLPDNYPEYNFSQNVAGALLKDKINGPYLLAFFLSSLGRRQILRSMMLSGQGKLELDDIRNYEIPTVSKNFKVALKKTIDSRLLKIKESKSSYENAELILLKSLGLANFQLSQEPVNIKSLSESFGNSGRLDAEYYQIKYEQVVERIMSTKYDRLADIVKIKKSIEPGSAHYTEEGLPFVRVSDYDKFGLSTPDKYLTDEFCKENAQFIKKLKPKKETILFSKDGSVGTAYMLRKDADFITSSAILHLTVKDKTKIIPEYLTLALNSKLVQMQAERDAGGSIILHWRVSEIENVVVPVIDFDKQREIADLVEESFKLKKQSEHLLEVAKTAVEMAIEQDEETALEFINNQTII